MLLLILRTETKAMCISVSAYEMFIEIHKTGYGMAAVAPFQSKYWTLYPSRRCLAEVVQAKGLNPLRRTSYHPFLALLQIWFFHTVVHITDRQLQILKGARGHSRYKAWKNMRCGFSLSTLSD
jgi:hypothetical protein